ncbi:LysM peptidoglycan-binding domain-containing protein [Lentibacillus sp. N15]|uniref:LysM peptidoglycan-binding domain-containing protein n=1 Tax=Lentibacillus songyuanensis TaxID=3136161 RepID=UPI0031BBA950
MKKVVAALATSVIIAGAAATSVSAQEYKVQAGDSLWDIADEYNTTVDDLMTINKLDSKTIHPDQKLSINESYKVEKGDTLDGISKKFDVKVADIKKWNDLDSDLIVIGQELEIKGTNIVQDDTADQSSDQTPSKTAENTTKNTQKTAKPASTKTKSTKSESKSNDAPKGKTISVSATAYTANCEGCSGVTSTGVDLKKDPDAKVIAVDPDVIPIGSEVYVEGYGNATAADVGSAIKGKKIDVHVSDKGEANSWGVRNVNVTILD